MKQASRISLERPRPRAQPAGRTYVVTGAGSGVGRSVARKLARAGARVVLLVRGVQGAREARAAVAGSAGDDRVQAYPLDLEDRDSVLAASRIVLERHPEIHGLLHCAGLALPERRMGPDGTERMFAVEVLGPFLLTRRLLAGLERGAPARIVLLTGDIRPPVPGAPRLLDLENLQGEARFRPLVHTRHLMLQKILLTRELGQRLRAKGVGSLVVQPSPARTDYLRNLPLHLRFLARALLVPGWPGPPEIAAEEIVHAATDPDLEGASGQYLVRLQPTVPPPPVRSGKDQKRLWAALEELVGEHRLAGG